MLQRFARLQYMLLAVVAFFALTHLLLGVRYNFDSQKNGHTEARVPFFGFHGPSLVILQPEARDAGLRPGDTVLAVKGQSYNDDAMIQEEARRSQPGQSLDVIYRRKGETSPQHTIIQLRPIHPGVQPIWSWVILSFFMIASFFCLMTGLYVGFARPRNPHAWLILGILGSFTSLFIATLSLSGPLKPVAIIWSVVSQTSMPVCLMLFGIYFPERSEVDVRFPWIKWVLMTPIFVLLPIDLLEEFTRSYNFAWDDLVEPYIGGINAVETVIMMLAISYFFVALIPKIRTATGDARRRLRVLFVGTSVGLTPFLVLALISLFKHTDIGQDVPQWIVLIAIGILFLFPMSLAYVVIVQRAMDLKILIRQGTKYAFARRSVLILQVLFSIWLGYTLVNFFQTPRANRRNVDIVRILGITAFVLSFRSILSRRLQQKIDQRFFREAYSSEQLLSELSEEVRNFTEVAPLLDTITQRIGDTLHIERIAVFLRSGDSYRLQLATGIPALPMMHPMLGSLSLAATSATITTLARGRGPETVYRDDPSSWLVDASDAERTALNDLSTELLVPLPGRNRLAGVMALGPKRSEEPYTRSDRQLLQSVATQTGFALENAELFENLSTEIAQRERVSREIEIAREVQERLFPQVYPKVEGVDLAGYCRPAQEVGGDYYDFFVLEGTTTRSSGGDARLALALGDISGKGISAALLMASLRASLRSAAQLQPGDLSTLMRHINRLVYESSTSNRYATFFYAEYDPASRVLTYVNAGHNPPLVLRGDRQISLEATGTVIGLLPDAPYSRSSMVLLPGDVLIAFTDGISEAMNPIEEEWGEERMVAAARSLLHKPDCAVDAEQLMNCILEAADAFTVGADQHDDMTLLICMVR
jgi:sigma-B regulation protein RsbU (phosphoserine phosphatase)